MLRLALLLAALLTLSASSANVESSAAKLASLKVDGANPRVQKSMAMNQHAVQQAALPDADLKPLWDGMSRTPWKRD